MNKKRSILFLSAAGALALAAFLMWNASAPSDNSARPANTPEASDPNLASGGSTSVPENAASPLAVPLDSKGSQLPDTSSAPLLTQKTENLPDALAAEAGETASAPAVARRISPEVVQTYQMYQAHAPLRTAEVADPDSRSNKRVLQTMMQKAARRAGLE